MPVVECSLYLPTRRETVVPSIDVLNKANRLIADGAITVPVAGTIWPVLQAGHRPHVVTLLDTGAAFCTCTFGRETGEQMPGANRQCSDVVAARELARQADAHRVTMMDLGPLGSDASR